MNGGIFGGGAPRPGPTKTGIGWPPRPSDRQVGISSYPAPGGVFNGGGHENAGVSPTADREIARWVYFSAPVGISALGAKIYTGAAGSVTRFGIRAVDWATMRPGALVIDAGTINSASSGDLEVTLASPVTLWGYYFLVYACQGGSPLFRVQAAVGDWFGIMAGQYGDWPPDGNRAAGYYQSGVTAELPYLHQTAWSLNPFGSGGGGAWIMMRRAPL